MPFSTAAGSARIAIIRAVAAAAVCTLTLAFSAEAAEPPVSSRGFVVEFYGRHCPPCKAMKPTIDRLIDAGFPLRTVCADDQPALTQTYGVSSVPTLILFIDNTEAERVQGRVPESRIRELFAKIPPEHRSRPPREQPQAKDIAKTRSPDRTRPRPVSARDAVGRTAAGSDAIVRASDSGANAEGVTDPMDASVRLRIRDDGYVDYGSGTVVHSGGGRTVIATCGHLFRDHDADIPVEVEFFRDGEPVQRIGRCLRFDEEADVGLVVVETERDWPIAAVAATANSPRKGDRMLTVGCSGGARPTVERTRLLALNCWVGPENIKVDRRPVRGRSGGGLFDSSGRLVGICIGYPEQEESGMYAGLGAIHDLLDACEMSSLYRRDAGPSRGALPIATASLDPLPATPAAMPARLGDWPQATAPPASRADSVATSTGGPASRGGKALAGDDIEMVCIIRSKSDPDAPSRVVIIDRVDDDLLERVAGPAAK